LTENEGLDIGGRSLRNFRMSAALEQKHYRISFTLHDDLRQLW